MHDRPARAARAAGGREVFDGATPPPRPRRPGSTRRSPTDPRPSSRPERRGRGGGRPVRERGGSPGRRPGDRPRAAAPVPTEPCSSRPADAGRPGRPGRPGGEGRGRRALAVGHRRRGTARARAAVRLVLGRRSRRLHPRGRHGPPRPPARVRRRPRPLGRARRPPTARPGRSPPRATRSCSGRSAAARAGSGSSRPSSSTWCPVPGTSAGRWSSPGPPSRTCCTRSPRGRRRCRRRSPPRWRCCGCRRSRTCRRRCAASSAWPSGSASPAPRAG